MPSGMQQNSRPSFEARLGGRISLTLRMFFWWKRGSVFAQYLPDPWGPPGTSSAAESRALPFGWPPVGPAGDTEAPWAQSDTPFYRARRRATAGAANPCPSFGGGSNGGLGAAVRGTRARWVVRGCWSRRRVCPVAAGHPSGLRQCVSGTDEGRRRRRRSGYPTRRRCGWPRSGSHSPERRP